MRGAGTWSSRAEGCAQARPGRRNGTWGQSETLAAIGRINFFRNVRNIIFLGAFKDIGCFLKALKSKSSQPTTNQRHLRNFDFPPPSSMFKMLVFNEQFYHWQVQVCPILGGGTGAWNQKIQHCPVKSCLVQFSTVWSSSVQSGPVQFSEVQSCPVQFSLVWWIRHDSVQRNTYYYTYLYILNSVPVQFSLVQIEHSSVHKIQSVNKARFSPM